MWPCRAAMIIIQACKLRRLLLSGISYVALPGCYEFIRLGSSYVASPGCYDFNSTRHFICGLARLLWHGAVIFWKRTFPWVLWDWKHKDSVTRGNVQWKFPWVILFLCRTFLRVPEHWCCHSQGTRGNVHDFSNIKRWRHGDELIQPGISYVALPGCYDYNPSM